MGKMAKGRAKTVTQLRGEYRFDEAEKRAFESRLYAAKMAMLSPISRARRSMERELSLVLRRPASKGDFRKRDKDPHYEIMDFPKIGRNSHRPTRGPVWGNM